MGRGFLIEWEDGSRSIADEDATGGGEDGEEGVENVGDMNLERNLINKERTTRRKTYRPPSHVMSVGRQARDLVLQQD